MTAFSCEVWGDPIAHSLSPRLHRAAYARLGWDWTYERRRVDEAGFAAAVAERPSTLRGLSCTMPLKRVAFEATDHRDARADLTGAANTLLFGDGIRAFNTDVGGIVRALAENGITQLDAARIVGAGATATSALVAVAELGARSVEIVARRPAAVAPLSELGERLGIRVDVRSFDEDASTSHPLTVSTLPGGVQLPGDAGSSLAAGGGLLFDAVYGHWPTDLARAWERAGAPAVSGEGMLLHQAVLQIRIFATGDVDIPLPDEDAVVAVMRAALVGG